MTEFLLDGGLDFFEAVIHDLVWALVVLAAVATVCRLAERIVSKDWRMDK